MLVLSRRVGEKIQIGDDVCLTVLKSSTGRVKVGIEAPSHIDIVRSECLMRDELKDPEAFDEQQFYASLPPELSLSDSIGDSVDSFCA